MRITINNEAISIEPCKINKDGLIYLKRKSLENSPLKCGEEVFLCTTPTCLILLPLTDEWREGIEKSNSLILRIKEAIVNDFKKMDDDLLKLIGKR